MPIQRNRKAILVLGSGRQNYIIELPSYQYQNLSPQSIERLKSRTRLAKETNLPILIKGGAPDTVDAKDLLEAKIIILVLKEKLCIEARWLEGQFNTIQYSVLQSSKILHQQGIYSIYLVIHFGMSY